MQRAAYIIYALYNVLSALLYCSSAISVCLMCDGSLCGQIITIITMTESCTLYLICVFLLLYMLPQAYMCAHSIVKFMINVAAVLSS